MPKLSILKFLKDKDQAEDVLASRARWSQRQRQRPKPLRPTRRTRSGRSSFFLPVQVQYCATSPGASQGPVSCEVSEYGYCGHGHNNLRNAPKVVNYERELKKLKDQIAATSDKEEKSKLIKRLNEVEKQHRVTDSADVWARQPLEV